MSVLQVCAWIVIVIMAVDVAVALAVAVATVVEMVRTRRFKREMRERLQKEGSLDEQN